MDVGKIEDGQGVVGEGVDRVDDILAVGRGTAVASVRVLLRLIFRVKVVDGDTALDRAGRPACSRCRRNTGARR